MKIVSKKENLELFTASWTAYTKNNLVGPYALKGMMEYYLITNKEMLVSDESFVILAESYDKTCVAICFFPIYQQEQMKYCHAVAPLAAKEKYLKICFEFIESIANAEFLDKIEFYVDTCYSQYGQWRYNYLRSYGYIDCTTTNYIFYLQDKPANLFQKFNMSSRNILRKFTKEGLCETYIYDHMSITRNIFDNYKYQHTICAGQQVRSDSSFNCMFNLICQKQAILLELNYKGKAIGYLLVTLSYPFATLSSIANLPDYEQEVPIYRILYWKAIEYCADYTVMVYGFPAGTKSVDGFKSYMSSEQLHIARYKQYMGAVAVPHFQGVRYFNDSLLEKEVKTFLEQIKNDN